MDELLVVPTVAEGAWHFEERACLDTAYLLETIAHAQSWGHGGTLWCGESVQGLASLPLFFLFSSSAWREWIIPTATAPKEGN